MNLEKDLTRPLETLPESGEAKAGLGSGPVEPGPPGRNSLRLPNRILLVDDERDFVETLSERFRLREVETTVVYDGAEALAAAAAEEPEVMVLDLCMPGTSGTDILRAIKTNHPAVEVIVLTGHGSPRDREECLGLGAFAFLQKPADFEELSEVMHRAVDKRRGG